MMCLAVSYLVPKGRAVLKQNGEVVAFGSLQDMCTDYQPGMVLVVSPHTDEDLRAELAKDVTPRTATEVAGSPQQGEGEADRG